MSGRARAGVASALSMALVAASCGDTRSGGEATPSVTERDDGSAGATGLDTTDAGDDRRASDADAVSDAPAPPGVGLLHTAPQLAFVRAHQSSAPWKDAALQVLSEADAALGRSPVPVADFDIPFYYADPGPSQAAKEGLRQDASAAYALALGYQLGATAAIRDAYAMKSIAFLDGWASINTKVSGPDGDLVVLYTGVPLLYAADLVWRYPGWPAPKRSAFLAWVATVFRKSADAIKTRTNNWGDWGTLGVVASAALAGDQVSITTEIDRIAGRIGSDIDAVGELPEENKRTNSGMWYTFFALTAMTTAARIAANVTGVDLTSYTAPNGRTIRLALERAFFYAQHPDQWPYHLPDGAAGQVWRQLYPCDDTVQMPTPQGWPGTLFEIMSDVYQVQAWEGYVQPYRPSRGYHGWIYPTLMRQTP